MNNYDWWEDPTFNVSTLAKEYTLLMNELTAIVNVTNDRDETPFINFTPGYVSIYEKEESYTLDGDETYHRYMVDWKAISDPFCDSCYISHEQVEEYDSREINREVQAFFDSIKYIRDAFRQYSKKNSDLSLFETRLAIWCDLTGNDFFSVIRTLQNT